MEPTIQRYQMTGIKRKRNPFRDWMKAALIALILFWLFTVFIVQIYPVTGSFMSSTILPGDFVLVNKLAYGPRFPITPLSIPFTKDHLPLSGRNSYLDWITLPAFRLPGYSSPGRNDLIFFNYPNEPEKPIDKRTRYVKRCIGLPGDTVQIIDKKVFVNAREFQESKQLQFAFRVMAKPKSIHRELLNDMRIFEGNLVSDAGIYRLYMTAEQADSLSKLPYVFQVRLEIFEKGFAEPMIFPQHPDFSWNLDQFGPLIIPGKNITIPLNKRNVHLYKSSIKQEKNTVETEGSRILINGVETIEYTFRSDFYFVMDDNRDNSKDSRFWGFLPGNHVIGKVSRVAFSFNKRNEGLSIVRWKRTMRAVDKIN
jgi:signal peptidase I